MRKTLPFLLVFTAILIAHFNLNAQSASLVKKPTLNHIALYVFDLKKSTEFYQHTLQLDTIPEPFHDGKHTWFSIGPLSHLHLIQGAKDFFAHDKNSHLCFTVASVPDFIKVLDAHHVEYENWAGKKMEITTRVDGVFQIYFKDPDGYWIEINDARR